MQKYIQFVIFIFVTGSFSGSIQAQERAFKDSEFIIQLTATAAQRLAMPDDKAVTSTGLSGLNTLNVRYNVKSITPLFRFPLKNQAIAEKYGLNRTYIVRVPVNSDLQRITADYNADPDIAYAETNKIAKAHFGGNNKRRADALQVIPTDDLYGNQWGLNNTGQAESYPDGVLVGTPGVDIDAELAWDLHTGSSSIILAIIDTGVDYNHPEFSGRIVDGWDYANGDSDPMDDNGHGTSCAGIAAADGNNGFGVAGVNWGCMIMPVKVLDSAGSGSYADIANGITFAADNGARVLSLSLGGSFNDATLENAVNYAFDLDCVILASRGNDDNTVASYPASYANVVAIGALSPCDERTNPNSCDGEFWWGSSYGSDLDVMAPGTRIYTTDITGSGGYETGDYMTTFNGTSAACPFAAGVVALLRSYDPSLTNADVRTRIRDTAVDMNTAGFDNETGYGRINAFNALSGSADIPPTITSTATTTATVDVAYSYDADNTVDASGSTPITFSLISGPTGFSVSSDGIVTWTPTIDQVGVQNVQIQASNTFGTDTQTFDVTVSEAPPPSSDILVNSAGPDYTTTTGETFLADFGFTGGSESSTSGTINGTADEALYQTYREGDGITYAFDVTNGDYDLTLYFVEPRAQQSTMRVFDVTAEGTVVLNDFDIYAASGNLIAHTETVAVTVSDGQMNLAFDYVSGRGNPLICAIKIASAGPPPPAEPDITVTPLNVDYGDVNVNTSSDAVVTITNDGTSDLQVTGLTSSDAAFVVSAPTVPFTLTAAGSQDVTVQFTPTAEQAYSGNLDITSDDPDEATVTVALAGNGIVPPPNEPDITVTPLALDYGDVTLSTTADDIITVTNDGTADLQVTGLTSSDAAFVVTSPTVPFTLAPAASQDITVQFAPVAEQAYAGNLDIVSDDPDEGTVTVSLTGNGVAAPPPPTGQNFLINSGGSDFTAGNGDFFVADKAYVAGDFGYSGGNDRTTGREISGTTDDALYQSVRFAGTFSYLFDTANGDYDVTCYFMEPQVRSTGQRTFDVSAEGTVMLNDFDIYATAGDRYTAVSQTFSVTVADGQLNLDFDGVSGDAMLCGIKVINTAAAAASFNDIQPGELETRLESTPLPEEFALGQNYPNPFNPETKIEFSIQKGMHVTLKIYNLLGQEIRTLVDGFQAQGNYSVRWNATNAFGQPVPSGVYIYQLKGQGFVQTSKMILMK